MLDTAHCSVLTAHCTVHTAPKPEPVPEYAPVQFILHNKHFAVHITHLYCMLHTYKELAEFKLKLAAAK